MMNYDELWWTMMNYDELWCWWIMYPSKWDMTWLNWWAIPAINPDLHNSSRNHRKVATAAGENGPGCGMRYDLRDPWGDVGVWACAGNHTTICQKWVQKCQKLSKMAQKIQPRSSTLGSYPKISKTMDGWWVDINWRMADIAKLHKSSHIEYFSWQTRSPLLNQIKHTWKQNTCQSILYSSHLLKIGEAANISTKPQTIQKNSLVHGRILLYMGGKKTTQ